jgi:hypothetical protein
LFVDDEWLDVTDDGRESEDFAMVEVLSMMERT